MAKQKFIALDMYREYPVGQMLERAKANYEDVRRRRTVRQFSDRPVPQEIIENCIKAAGTAPSGANMQPWHFVAVSDAAIKKEIRKKAEEEEYAFYHQRAPEEWLEDLQPFETNEDKPFLETAPWLIAVFEQRYGLNDDGSRKKHYYVTESVGLATGLLINAVHHAGLVSLTHTPSPMKFLNDILKRPQNEKPFLLLVVGYPAEDARVPDIGRKGLNEIATFF